MRIMDACIYAVYSPICIVQKTHKKANMRRQPKQYESIYTAANALYIAPSYIYARTFVGLTGSNTGYTGTSREPGVIIGIERNLHAKDIN